MSDHKTPNEFTIVHISDLHAGSQYFIAHMMERVIEEMNEAEPDAVIVTGDLTEMGFVQEYSTSKAFLDRLECDNVLVVPGNHDARNVGYLHFEDHFGPLDWAVEVGPVKIVGLDSSEPDLDEGRIGREKYHFIVDSMSGNDAFKIVALHHHLISVPGSGRERNIIIDAGDLLSVLAQCGVHLVLSGHKHVPHIWRFEGMYLANTGTASTLRVRGYTDPCYNIITLTSESLRIYRKYPFGAKELQLETGKLDALSCLTSLPEKGERRFER